MESSASLKNRRKQFSDTCTVFGTLATHCFGKIWKQFCLRFAFLGYTATAACPVTRLKSLVKTGWIFSTDTHLSGKLNFISAKKIWCFEKAFLEDEKPKFLFRLQEHVRVPETRRALKAPSLYDSLLRSTGAWELVKRPGGGCLRLPGGVTGPGNCRDSPNIRLRHISR